MASDYWGYRRTSADGAWEEIARNCTNCGWIGFHDVPWCPKCDHSLGAKSVTLARCTHNEPDGCPFCRFITRAETKRNM